MVGPWQWLALDIETAGGRPEDAEAWMRWQWSPASNWKPETIGNRYLEMLGKKRERLALLDASGVIAVAMRTSSGETLCIHSMTKGTGQLATGAVIQGFESEREMLLALRLVLDGHSGDETTLVGHAVKSFDLPRLRNAFLRAGLRLPVCLVNPEQPVFDTMKEYERRFSADTDIMVSLANVCDGLKVPTHKSMVNGSDVAGLFAAGKFDEIALYCLLDVCCEAEVFLRMTGQSTALE